MDDISELWDSFSLNDKEEVPFDFGPASEADVVYLAARFMTSRVINIESVVRTFRPLWRTVQGFTARDMGSNMLVFVFQDESDVERILSAEPWSYDKHLVSFQRVEADTSIAEMECRWVSFWVQIHNLPVRRMNHETASALGGTLGLVEKVVESDEERGCEGCIRVRVRLDISQPLCRGRKARLLAGKETLISFKYERLPNFCYWCGRLTHGDRDCEWWLRSKGTLRREDQQYGAWMRAAVEKPIRRVEVKVAGRSNTPRWGSMRHDESGKGGNQAAPPEGGRRTAAGETSMDFAKFKESLPDFQESPCKEVDLEDPISTDKESNLSSPASPVELAERIGTPKVVVTEIKESHNVESPITMQSSIPTAVSAYTLQQEVLGDVVGVSANKNNRSSPCKTHKESCMQTAPGGKENFRGMGSHNSAPDNINLGEPRGVWKRVLREKIVNENSEGPYLVLGVKRGGTWDGYALSGLGSQKKVRGDDGTIRCDVDGDMAAAVDQPRRTQ